MMAEVPEMSSYYLTLATQTRTCRRCGSRIPEGTDYVYCPETTYRAVRDDSEWSGPPASYCLSCADREELTVTLAKRWIAARGGVSRFFRRVRCQVTMEGTRIHLGAVDHDELVDALDRMSDDLAQRHRERTP